MKTIGIKAKHFFYIFLLIFLAWGLSFFYIVLIIGKGPDNPGTFGDTFGAVNALFSGCAFAGLIITILLQKQDNDETKKQFKIQLFENSFFHLINLYNEVVDSLNYTVQNERIDSISTKKGKDVFVTLYGQFKHNLDNIIKRQIENEIKAKMIRQEINNFFKNYEGIISHYYNNIVTIVSHIATKKIDNKHFYFHIFFTQLTAYEITLLCYFYLSDWNPAFVKDIQDNNLTHYLKGDDVTSEYQKLVRELT